MTKPFILGAASCFEAAFLSTKGLHRAVRRDAGNLAIAHAVRTHLGEETRSAKWSDPIEAINRSGTLAVVPATDHLCEDSELAEQADRIQQMALPVVAVGLAVQGNQGCGMKSTSPNAVRWLHALADHAPTRWPNMGVQGPSTMAALDRLGLADRASVIGCPSLFINRTPVLGKQIAERMHKPSRVAVIAGSPRWHRFGRIEASLAQLVTQTRGSYIAQSPLEMMMLGRGEARAMDDVSLRACRDYIQPNMHISHFVDWTIRHGNVFWDIQRWLEHYRRFDIVIGMRVHGVLLGIQAGIPGLCIAHDARTVELCETLKVPHLFARDVIDGVSLDLFDHLEFDAEEFDRNRRAMCRRYVQFLWGNGVAPPAWLGYVADYWRESVLQQRQQG